MRRAQQPTHLRWPLELVRKEVRVDARRIGEGGVVHNSLRVAAEEGRPERARSAVGAPVDADLAAPVARGVVDGAATRE